MIRKCSQSFPHPFVFRSQFCSFTTCVDHVWSRVTYLICVRNSWWWGIIILVIRILNGFNSLDIVETKCTIWGIRWCVCVYKLYIIWSLFSTLCWHICVDCFFMLLWWRIACFSLPGEQFLALFQVQLLGGGAREWKSSNQHCKRRGICTPEAAPLPNSDSLVDTAVKGVQPISNTGHVSFESFLFLVLPLLFIFFLQWFTANQQWDCICVASLRVRL